MSARPQRAANDPPSRPIAWSPLDDRQRVGATAVHCLPCQSLGKHPFWGYLELLAWRIQRLVDGSPDPDEAAHYFLAAMIENSLLRDGRPCPAFAVGDRLVLANQAIEARLMQWHVPRAVERPVVVVSLAAHAALAADDLDPFGALQMWAWRMGKGARMGAGQMRGAR